MPRFIHDKILYEMRVKSSSRLIKWVELGDLINIMITLSEKSFYPAVY